MARLLLPADYTFPAADQGKHSFQVTLKTAGSQTLSITDSTGSTLKATANISVSTSAQLLVLGGFGQSATAGAQQNLTVTVTDSFGNVITNYLGTVHFTSSDAAAALPADYTFTAADQGKHTFAVTLNTAGSQSISATDLAHKSLTGTIVGMIVAPAQASTAVRLQITVPTSGHVRDRRPLSPSRLWMLKATSPRAIGVRSFGLAPIPPPPARKDSASARPIKVNTPSR